MVSWMYLIECGLKLGWPILDLSVLIGLLDGYGWFLLFSLDFLSGYLILFVYFNVELLERATLLRASLIHLKFETLRGIIVLVLH